MRSGPAGEMRRDENHDRHHLPHDRWLVVDWDGMGWDGMGWRKLMYATMVSITVITIITLHQEPNAREEYVPKRKRSRLRPIIIKAAQAAVTSLDKALTKWMSGWKVRRQRRSQDTKQMKHLPRQYRLRRVRWIPRAMSLCALLAYTEALAMSPEGAMVLP
jgi:hypothetical protein